MSQSPLPSDSDLTRGTDQVTLYYSHQARHRTVVKIKRLAYFRNVSTNVDHVILSLTKMSFTHFYVVISRYILFII